MPIEVNFIFSNSKEVLKFTPVNIGPDGNGQVRFLFSVISAKAGIKNLKGTNLEKIRNSRCFCSGRFRTGNGCSWRFGNRTRRGDR
ncbi:hypothetical protein TMRH483_00495 [Qipengyuania sp. 483]